MITITIDTGGSSTNRHGRAVPRYVGPFPDREAADAWARETIFNGTWDCLTTVHPELATGLQQSASGETVYLGSFAQYADQPNGDRP